MFTYRKDEYIAVLGWPKSTEHHMEKPKRTFWPTQYTDFLGLL